MTLDPLSGATPAPVPSYLRRGEDSATPREVAALALRTAARGGGVRAELVASGRLPALSDDAPAALARVGDLVVAATSGGAGGLTVGELVAARDDVAVIEATLALLAAGDPPGAADLYRGHLSGARTAS